MAAHAAVYAGAAFDDGGVVDSGIDRVGQDTELDIGLELGNPWLDTRKLLRR